MGKIATFVWVACAIFVGLFFLGAIFNILGLFVGLIAGVVGLALKLLFSKVFWVLLLAGGIAYLWHQRGPQQLGRTSHSAGTEDQIAHLEQRLDRLNRTI